MYAMQVEDLTTFLIAEGIFIAVVLLLLVIFTVRSNHNLQNGVLMQVKALMRYVQHMRSDDYRKGIEEKLRAKLEQEQQVQLLQIQAAAPAPAPVVELVEVVTPVPEMNQAALDEWQQLEAASREYEAEADNAASFSDDMAKMRELIREQEMEISRLREKIRGEKLSDNISAMMDAQQRQIKHYQQAERDLNMCIQMQEHQLQEAKERFNRAMGRLRSESEANNTLRAQVQRLEQQLRQPRR